MVLRFSIASNIAHVLHVWSTSCHIQYIHRIANTTVVRATGSVSPSQLYVYDPMPVYYLEAGVEDESAALETHTTKSLPEPNIKIMSSSSSH